MFKKLGVAALGGLMLMGGAWAVDTVNSIEPQQAHQPASQGKEVLKIRLHEPGEGLLYLYRPNIEFDNRMLRGEQRQAKIRLLVRADGRVDSVQILSSTDVEELDRLIIRRLRTARFNPYMENGVALPTVVIQTLNFALFEE